MTTETTGQTKKPEATREAPGCCMPRCLQEQMASCGASGQDECAALLQAMMKGGCCRPETK